MGTVFIDVPIAVLRERLGGRGEAEVEIERRMVTAATELAERAKFDFVIESRSRDEDFARLREICDAVRQRAAG